MIYVDRSMQPVPFTLDGKDSAGGLERVRNSELAKLGRSNEMKFLVYSSQPVKIALGKLFHRKCAYCESLLLGNQPGDVEHYRPKSKVRLNPKSGNTQEVPGYYWLAADWNNLLLSCVDCNRPRRQLINGNGVEVKGKSNWFPIKDENYRAKDEKGVKNEFRLLLNPCVDDPERHLLFHDDGSIEPKRKSAMGVATIAACGLDRVELLQARAMQREHADPLIYHILKNLSENREPDEKDIECLIKLMHPSRPYSAFIRSVVRAKIGALFG